MNTANREIESLKRTNWHMSYEKNMSELKHSLDGLNSRLDV